jgi:hypothetical protein
VRAALAETLYITAEQRAILVEDPDLAAIDHHVGRADRITPAR